MSAHCQSIRDEIETLEQSIELLDIQIQNTVDPIQKSALFRFRKQSLSLLQRKREALKACEESGPPLPQVPADMSDFGSEVTQGILVTSLSRVKILLQEYLLVAAHP